MGRDVAQASAFLKPSRRLHHLARIRNPHDCVLHMGPPPPGILILVVGVGPVHGTPKILPGDSAAEVGGEALTWTSSIVLLGVKGA